MLPKRQQPCGLECWALALGVGLAVGGGLMASEIKSDERVLFFPTAARLADDGRSWQVPIHGWIFEPESNSLLRKAAILTLRKALDLDEKQTKSEIFQERIAAFLVDNERGKQLSIRVGSRLYTLPQSEPGGHFEGSIAVPKDIAQRLAVKGQLRFQAVTRSGDERIFAGTAFLIPPTGISVISDIDDTIKISEVKNKRKLLENTLLKPFQAAPGMPELYARWAQAGAQVHFVSNGPWQLYEPLEQFRQAAGFPAATFLMRKFRLKDSSAREMLAPAGDAKRAAVERFLTEFPQRQFVLVGDSGEQDPEAYCDMAGRFPGRVLRIYIRDVTGENDDSKRFRELFGKLPPGIGHVFQDPATLQLPGM